MYTALVFREGSGAASASSGPSAAPAPASSGEIVERPPAGLARGKWEAQPWAFYALGAAVVVTALVYAAARLGLFSRLRARLQPRPGSAR